MKRDKNELIELMNTHGNYLKKTAFHILHDMDLAEDMVQETFISYYQRSQFKGRSTIRTYLYKILINHIKMYLRKNKLTFNRDEKIYISQETISFEALSVNQMDLSYAINNLDEKYKEVIILYYFDDLSVKDISQIVGCSVSSVKMTLKRGRVKLKEMLGGEHENIS